MLCSLLERQFNTIFGFFTTHTMYMNDVEQPIIYGCTMARFCGSELLAHIWNVRGMAAMQAELELPNRFLVP